MSKSIEILDDNNFQRETLTKEEKSKNKWKFKLARKIHLLIGGLILIGGLMWIYVIILGYLELGRMPGYEDSRMALKNPLRINFDTLVYSLIFMIYGTGYWILQLIIVLIGKFYTPKKTNIAIGLIGISFLIYLITSPQLEWILD